MPSLQTVTGKFWDRSLPGSSSRRSWANGWVGSAPGGGTSGLSVSRAPTETLWIMNRWCFVVLQLHEASVRYLRGDLQRRSYIHPQRPEIQRSAWGSCGVKVSQSHWTWYTTCNQSLITATCQSFTNLSFSSWQTAELRSGDQAASAQQHASTHHDHHCLVSYSSSNLCFTNENNIVIFFLIISIKSCEENLQPVEFFVALVQLGPRVQCEQVEVASERAAFLSGWACSLVWFNGMFKWLNSVHHIWSVTFLLQWLQLPHSCGVTLRPCGLKLRKNNFK